MRRCPLTYELLSDNDPGKYSRAGLRKLSRSLVGLRDLEYTAVEQRREAMARANRMSIQGVQPKLSARLVVKDGRFEVVDRGGRFILKPQNQLYANLPENEDLSMRLAGTVGIELPLHGLLNSADDSLTYFVKRFDRVGRNRKLAVEDFAQLAGRTRDTKYDFSMERLIPIIEEHCTFPAVEKLELFRRTLFCFLTGNEDMHLKNFSLIDKDNIIKLSPAYDLVNSTIVLPGSQEELALPLNGRKRKLSGDDLVQYYGSQRLELTSKSIDDVLSTLSKEVPKWEATIKSSFLPTDLKTAYWELVQSRSRTLIA
jgi:serine/threonine-protein kinase HipA